jgi:hypothetical protein
MGLSLENSALFSSERKSRIDFIRATGRNNQANP